MFRGLRVGYLVVPKDLVEPFRIAKWMADRHTPLVEQAALADFLREGHLERHIRRMRRLYKRRRDALLEALDRHFGRRAAVRGDAAGLHLTVRFSGAGNLRTRAERNGVGLSSSEHLLLTATTERVRRVHSGFFGGDRANASRGDQEDRAWTLNMGRASFVSTPNPMILPSVHVGLQTLRGNPVRTLLSTLAS